MIAGRPPVDRRRRRHRRWRGRGREQPRACPGGAEGEKGKVGYITCPSKGSDSWLTTSHTAFSLGEKAQPGEGREGQGHGQGDGRQEGQEEEEEEETPQVN